MDFYLGRSDWKTLQRGEEHSFLLVNGLGGYCSQTVIGSNARHDHNLLTAALVAPTKRFAMVRRIEEILHVGSNAYRLDSQAYVTSSDDAAGFRFLDSFFYDGLPSWEYMAEFQSFNLVPVLSVYENIVLPLQLDGKTVDNAFIGEIAEALGLKEKLNVLPNQLSGGQQQRVAIARALAAKPAILLADEPTGNLDSCTSQDVMGLLKTTSTKFSQTIVMITHNEEIAQLADRIIRIEDGRIVTGKAGEAL